MVSNSPQDHQVEQFLKQVVEVNFTETILRKKLIFYFLEISFSWQTPFRAESITKFRGFVFRKRGSGQWGTLLSQSYGNC
jgi:hypothetical protein